MFILITVIIIILIIIIGLIWVNWGRSKLGTMVTNNSGFQLEPYISHPWYQYVYLPNWFQDDCTSNVVAKYSKEKDSNFVVVNNSCEPDNKATGLVYVYDKSGKLKVGFLPKPLLYVDKFLQLFGDINAFTGDYYVLKTDNTNYAMVGSADLKFLWLLEGEKGYYETNDGGQKLKELINYAKDLGYPIKDLTLSDGTSFS